MELWTKSQVELIMKKEEKKKNSMIDDKCENDICWTCLCKVYMSGRNKKKKKVEQEQHIY